MDALRKIKIDQHVIIGGPIQFDAKGQNVNIKAAAMQNLKRKPTVVMPERIRRREAGLPGARLERPAPDLSVSAQSLLPFAIPRRGGARVLRGRRGHESQVRYAP